MAQCQGPRSQMVRFVCGLHPYLARRFCKNFQSTVGPTQCKSSPVNNMVSKRNYLLFHFSITIYLHLASFYATILYSTFENKSARGNAHWTNYWLWIEGLGPTGRTCTPTTGYFHDKTKIFKEYLQVDYLLLAAKILQEAINITSPYLRQLNHLQI